MAAKKKVLVANGQGFWGDSILGPVRLVREGPLDYLAVAHAFHTVVIENVPVLTPNRRDIARRFINLIDTLYDTRVCLVISADAEPHQLYAAGDGVDLFQRTASRLIDMRSEAYQAERGKRVEASVSDSTAEATPAT